MNDVNEKVSYKGKEYKLVFNLNVMQVIQEKYGSVAEWWKKAYGANGEADVKAVIFRITEMFNEGIDMDNDENGADTAFLSHKQVGRIISAIGITEVTSKMSDVIVGSTESAEKNA